MKTINLICLTLFLFFSNPIFSANEINPISEVAIERLTTRTPSKNTTINLDWFRQNNTSNQLSFPTQSGFVLVRKEDIIFMSLDAKSNLLWLHYKKGNQVEKIACRQNLKTVMQRINDFPFLQISRSTIVNVNEIDLFEGTKRDATLVMKAGARLKISRNKIGLIYDWLNELSA